MRTAVGRAPVQLNTALSNFFAGRARYPEFKRTEGAQPIEHATSAFVWDVSRRGVRLAWYGRTLVAIERRSV